MSNLKFVKLRMDYTYSSECLECELEVCSGYTATLDFIGLHKSTPEKIQFKCPKCGNIWNISLNANTEVIEYDGNI